MGIGEYDGEGRGQAMQGRRQGRINGVVHFAILDH
jgi:hypothetical protein